MLRATAVMAGFLVFSAAGASAQVMVEEIRLQVFKEQSGTFSENIAGSRDVFENAVSGRSQLGEPADAMLVTLVVSGPKNSKSSDKIARDLASVTVTQAAKTGPRVLLKRAYGGFMFGNEGRSHKAFWLEGATCAPLEVDVRLGRSRKTTKVEFRCDS
jgi:hypothetical protein